MRVVPYHSRWCNLELKLTTARSVCNGVVVLSKGNLDEIAGGVERVETNRVDQNYLSTIVKMVWWSSRFPSGKTSKWCWFKHLVCCKGPSFEDVWNEARTSLAIIWRHLLFWSNDLCGCITEGDLALANGSIHALFANIAQMLLLVRGMPAKLVLRGHDMFWTTHKQIGWICNLDGRNHAIVIAESLARVIAAIRIASVRWRSYRPPKHKD